MKWLPSEGFWERRGLPEPTPEFKFHPTRKWKVDFVWKDKMVALEVEGGIWNYGGHVRGSGFLRDSEKYNEMTRMGWHLYRLTPKQLETDRMMTNIPKRFKGKIETTSEFLRSVLSV